MKLPELDIYRAPDVINTNDDRWYIAKKGCKGIDLTKEEADEVIRRCDCHDELVEACKIALDDFQNGHNFGATIDQLEDALDDKTKEIK